MPFHLEFRPKTFDEVRGNKETVKALREILGRADKPHSYLLIGQSGCGKTTLARLIAKELGCHDTEFFEFNTADDRGLDFIRSVIETSRFVPTLGKVKVYLFDEVHQITGSASEALLKFLEDTPRYVYIILATTTPEKLIPTLKNRCSTFEVRPLNDNDLLVLLLDVVEKKDLKVTNKVLEAIYELADGCPRQALILLEKVCNVEEDEALKLLESASVSNTKVLCASLMNRSKDWLSMAKILKELDDDPETVRRGVLGYMEKVLFNSKTELQRRASSEIVEIFSHNLWEGGKPKLVQCFYKAFLKMQELK